MSSCDERNCLSSCNTGWRTKEDYGTDSHLRSLGEMRIAGVSSFDEHNISSHGNILLATESTARTNGEMKDGRHVNDKRVEHLNIASEAPRREKRKYYFLNPCREVYMPITTWSTRIRILLVFVLIVVISGIIMGCSLSSGNRLPFDDGMSFDVTKTVTPYLIPSIPTNSAPNQISNIVNNVTEKATNNWICPHCHTLEDLYSGHIKPLICLGGSNLFTPPMQEHMDDMESVVTDMLGSSACAAIPLHSLFGMYKIGPFTDLESSLTYCVLATTSASSPWGNVIVNQGANTKNLSIESPHPLADLYTAEQALAVFKGTNARSFLVSGAHRKSSDVPSPCDGTGYRVSDAAHSIAGGFNSAAKAVMDHYEAVGGADYTAIQFHGMGASHCPGVDAFFSHGVSFPPKPNDKIVFLRDELRTLLGSGTFLVPGELPPCNLVGSRNVQGRMINGVGAADACTVPATSYTGRFIHLEQKLWLRQNTSAWHNIWVRTVNNAYSRF